MGSSHAPSPHGVVSVWSGENEPTDSMVSSVSRIIPAMRYVSWKAVFHFPSLSAASTCPASMAIWRRPVTRNSRPMISAVTHTGHSPSAVRNTKAEQTRILSASGSRSLPSGVMRFIFLASQPSTKSLIAAMMKRIRAVK